MGIPFACLKANKIPAGPERGNLGASRIIPPHYDSPHCRSQHPESDGDITPPSVAIGSVNGMGCFHRLTRIFGTTKTVEVSPNFCSFLPPSALARFHGDAWGFLREPWCLCALGTAQMSVAASGQSNYPSDPWMHVLSGGAKFRNPHHSFPSSQWHSPSSGGARAIALAVSLSFASALFLTWPEHRGLETAS